MAESKITLRSDAAASILEPEKTLRASKALIAHMKSEAEKKATSAEKKQLLADDDFGSLAETPVFVTFTTKRHLTESRNLKRESVYLGVLSPNTPPKHLFVDIRPSYQDPHPASHRDRPRERNLSHSRRCMSRPSYCLASPRILDVSLT